MSNEAKWVVEAWAEELKTVLQFLTGEDWEVSVAPATTESSTSGHYWWTQRFNCARGATVGIGAPPLAWSELGARILQTAGVDLIEQATAKSTYLEAIQQSTSGLARILSDRIGRSVEASGGRDEAPEDPGAVFQAVLAAGDFDLPPIRVVVSEELAAACGSPPLAVQKSAEIALAVDAPPSALASRNVSVLLDVQMPVSISFGRSMMPLREILKLTTGSAVELDRRPDDEVDVIVNDCVIARGQVVVIEGNYGIRVTEIISREQRLALRAGART